VHNDAQISHTTAGRERTLELDDNGCLHEAETPNIRQYTNIFHLRTVNQDGCVEMNEHDIHHTNNARRTYSGLSISLSAIFNTKFHIICFKGGRPFM